jgi:hypothetical protein
MTNGMPVSTHISTAGAGAGIVTVNIGVSSAAPCPFAGYPIGAGIRSSRTYVYRFGRAVGYIIISST